MRYAILTACAGALAACSWPLAPEAPALRPPQPQSAQALAGQGRYAEAIALLEAEAGRRPSAALLGDLGYAYYLDGRLLPAQAALERACLLEPGNAFAWERLAAFFEAQGNSARALAAMQQARMLREAAIAARTAAPEYAGARAGRAVAQGGGHDGGEGALWPAEMARVEVRQVGAGLVEVTRVPGRAGAASAGAPAAPHQRLEVSNGNGARGMAAAVAQRLRAQGMQVVRLTNTIPFDVEQTRVEVRGGREPELRIVLGKDQIKKPPARGRRQAP